MLYPGQAGCLIYLIQLELDRHPSTRRPFASLPSWIERSLHAAHDIYDVVAIGHLRGERRSHLYYMSMHA